MSKTAKGETARASSLHRRDFLLASGAAVGAAAAGGLSLPRRVYAQTAKSEITFASARFFAKDSMNEVVERYNSSQIWSM